MKSCGTCKHWKESKAVNRPYQERRGNCGFDFESIACCEYPFGYIYPTKPTDGENCSVWSAK